MYKHRSEDELKKMLYTVPFEVRFLGLVGDTLSLARAGWEFTMRQIQEYAYDDITLQLAMKHSACDTIAYSRVSTVRMEQLYGLRDSSRDPMATMMAIAKTGFDIQFLGSNGMVRIMPERAGVSWKSEWEPVDMRPQEYEDVSLKSFKFFKVAKPSVKDIVITSEMVPEVLDMVMKAQGSVQEEIRRRERSRQNLVDYRGMSVAPAHSVEAQIITLAG